MEHLAQVTCIACCALQKKRNLNEEEHLQRLSALEEAKVRKLWALVGIVMRLREKEFPFSAIEGRPMIRDTALLTADHSGSEAEDRSCPPFELGDTAAKDGEGARCRKGGCAGRCWGAWA